MRYLVFLLLVQLGNSFILLLHFVLERANLVVLRLLLGLGLAQRIFDVLDLLLERFDLSLDLLLGTLNVSIAVFGVSKAVVELLKVRFPFLSRCNLFFLQRVVYRHRSSEIGAWQGALRPPKVVPWWTRAW